MSKDACCAPSQDGILYSEALAALETVASAQGLFGTERLGLEDRGRLLGRVLAEGVFSRESLPRYDNSAVDGFALRSRDVGAALKAGNASFAVVGRVVAGQTPPELEVSPLSAWEIMTGAPFPRHFDCSVKVEDVLVTRDADGRATRITLPSGCAAPEAGDFVRPAGEDFKPGQPVLAQGQSLAPAHVLGAAAVGCDTLTVRRRPRVAVVSTGQEVVAFDAPLGGGQIRNSTLPFLKAELARLGYELVFCATVDDDPRALSSALAHARDAEPDLILTTGGVSMGVYDHVGAVAADLGFERVFHRVAIRPGKPILVARAQGGGATLVGLPGNPLSTVVGMRFFVEPFLRVRQGRRPEAPLRVRLAASAGKPEGLRCFFKGRLEVGASGALEARVLRGQASFMISPLLEANAWVVLGEGGERVEAGAEVEVWPLHSGEGWHEDR